MTQHPLARAVTAAALIAAGLATIAGTASAETTAVDDPQGSTDVADYNSDGFDSAEQPEQPYFDGGPVNSGAETIYGFVGAPAAGLLGGNLPIPRG